MFYHRHFSEAFYSRVYFSAFQPFLKIKKCVQTEECTHEKYKLRFATTQKTQSLPTNTEASGIRKLAFLPIVKTPSSVFVTNIEFLCGTHIIPNKNNNFKR